MDYEAKYDGCEIIYIHMTRYNHHSVEHIALNHREYLRIIFEDAAAAWNETQNVNRARSAVYIIMCKLFDDQSNNFDDRFIKALSYMRNNLSDSDISINDICRICGISESSLNRRFNKHYGVSSKQYFIKMRLAKALEMLVKNKLSIKEIATSCGFANEKHFARLIKERYGQPPSAFTKPT